MKNTQKLFILPLMVLTLASCQNPNADPHYSKGDDLKIISIEMSDEYGESTLIKYENYEIVIDSGNFADSNHVTSIMEQYVTDKTIDLMVITHPHGDHFGGFIDGCFDDFSVSKLVDFGYTYSPSGEGDNISSSSLYNSYVSKRNQMVAKGTNYTAITNELSTHPTLDIDVANNLSITWLKNDYYVAPGVSFPNSTMPNVTNPNSTSVAFSLSYKYWNFPFLGDADSTYAEYSIVNNHKDLLTADWKKVCLKATHHASSSSDGTSLLNWAHPDAAFVSAAMLDSVCVPNQVVLGSGTGEQNHPNKTTVSRIKNALALKNSTSFYWNGINGDLTITCDGVNDLTFSGAGRSKDYYIKNTTDIASREDEKNVTFFNSEFYQYYLR